MAINHQERVPFAVVGSNTIIEGEGGKKSRGWKYFEINLNYHNGTPTPGRKYPWGVVDIENLQHCDFLPLRNMLIKVCSIVNTCRLLHWVVVYSFSFLQTHLTDLRDVTNYVHYENFRCRKLAGVAGTDKVLFFSYYFSSLIISSPGAQQEPPVHDGGGAEGACGQAEQNGEGDGGGLRKKGASPFSRRIEVDLDS